MNPHATTPSGQRGLALVTVLWVVALMSIIAVSVLRTGRTDLTLARNVSTAVRAQLLSRAAVELVVFRLLQGNSDPRSWQLDGSIYAWRDADASYAARATSEHGRIDLNTASEALLRELALALGMSEQDAQRLSTAIIGRRDRLAATRIGGATGADARQRGPIHERQAPFLSIAELTSVADMNGSAYRRLEAFVTVYSGREQPDAAAALPTVQIALNGDRIAESGRITVDHRVLDDLQEMPSVVHKGRGSARPPGRLYRIEVQTRLSNGHELIEYAVIQLTPGDARPYRMLFWTQSVFLFLS